MGGFANTPSKPGGASRLDDHPAYASTPGVGKRTLVEQLSPSTAHGVAGTGRGVPSSGNAPAAPERASSMIADQSAPASLPTAVSSSPSAEHPAEPAGQQPAKANDLQGAGRLAWAGAGKAGRVFRNATADSFVDAATREAVELETNWTMAEFDQFELKTNMLMEVERRLHIQLAHGGVVIKSRVRAFFQADQVPNDVHAALVAPAKLVTHDGAIFVTDDKGMHLLRTLEHLLSETPSVAGLLAHEPMLGFDIDPKQRIREANQFVTVTVPTYERNLALVDGIMRDAPPVAIGLQNYIKVKLAHGNPPAEALAVSRHLIGRIEELVQFSWTGYEGTDLRVQLHRMLERFQQFVQQAEAAKPADKAPLDHASDLVIAIGKAGVGVVLALQEVGLMARDLGLWGLDKLSNAFGHEIDWGASSSIGKAHESGKSTSEIFHAVVDGIIDSWSTAIEHAENGDYSRLMDLGAELALDIAIEVVTAGAATPGVAAKRAGTAARLAEHALVVSEEAVEAIARRTETMLQRAQQALRRVPEEARAALQDTIDTATGWLTGLKDAVKIADPGVGTMRLVDKTAITQAMQRSRGARAIEAAKGAMTKLRGPAARAQGASVVEQLERLAKASKMPDTIYAVARRIAEGDNKAKFVAALDKLLKGTARALDEDVVVGVLQRAADAVDPLAFLDNVEWVMGRKGISVAARKALVRQAVLRDSPLDLRWLRELTELPDDMLEMMALDPATPWRSFMKVSKKPSDYFPSPLKNALKVSDYADAGAKLRGIAGELVFVLEDLELPGGLKVVGRQVGAGGRVIDFALQDARGARALLEVKAWNTERWTRELAEAAKDKPRQAFTRMIDQLRSARSTGRPVYLAVSDAIGADLAKLQQMLERYRIRGVKTVLFPEAKLIGIRSTLREGLALASATAVVSADQLFEKEDDD
jgi:hypothetical protein